MKVALGYLSSAIAIGLCFASLQTREAFAEVSPYCETPETHVMDLAAFPGQPKGPFFRYSFRIRKARTKHAASTIIYLPGGPGAPSMDRVVQPWMNDFNLVFTDLRGAGCNSSSEELLPNDALRTELAAADILAVIDYLGDSQRSGIVLGPYIIYGRSYGTILATVVGHQIERSGRPRPAGIVLEGTVGHSRASLAAKMGEVMTTVNHILPEVKSSLSAESLKAFGDRQPFGISNFQWFTAMGMLLTSGSLPVEGVHGISFDSVAESILNSPSPGRAISKLLEGVNEDNQFLLSRAYQNISCRELFATFDFLNIEWENGEFQATRLDGKSPCVRRGRFFPYDSAQFQLETPLYYFHGTRDLQALYGEGRYHFENQVLARKFFVTVDKGGHHSLTQEMGAETTMIFEKVAEGSDAAESYFAGHLNWKGGVSVDGLGLVKRLRNWLYL